MGRFVAILASVIMNALLLQAQEQPQQSAPKTKLEAFEAQEGVVVVRGFSKIGGMRGVYGGVVSVQSMEVTNATAGMKEYGIAVDVKEATHLEREDRSFIDYDEVTSLIKGIDFIAKVDKTVTKLDNFQANYQTKGDFAISVFNSGNKTVCTISSGRIAPVSVLFKIVDLVRLRDLITTAKSKLDEIRTP